MKKTYIIFIFVLSWSKITFSQTKVLTSEKIDFHKWMCHIALQYYNMKSSEGDKLRAPSMKLAFGYQSYERIWNWGLSFDLYIGPFDYARHTSLSVDYTGYGLSFWTAFNPSYFSASTIFHYLTPTMGLSFLMNRGASHDNLKTQLIQTNNLTTNQAFSDYNMKIKNISFLPGFYTNLYSHEPSRSKKPVTAVHEVFMQVNFSISIYSSYTSSYKKQVKTLASSYFQTLSNKRHMPGNYYLLSIGILFY